MSNEKKTINQLTEEINGDKDHLKDQVLLINNNEATTTTNKKIKVSTVLSDLEERIELVESGFSATPVIRGSYKSLIDTEFAETTDWAFNNYNRDLLSGDNMLTAFTEVERQTNTITYGQFEEGNTSSQMRFSKEGFYAYDVILLIKARFEGTMDTFGSDENDNKNRITSLLNNKDMFSVVPDNWLNFAVGNFESGSFNTSNFGFIEHEPISIETDSPDLASLKLYYQRSNPDLTGDWFDWPNRRLEFDVYHYCKSRLVFYCQDLNNFIPNLRIPYKFITNVFENDSSNPSQNVFDIGDKFIAINNSVEINFTRMS